MQHNSKGLSSVHHSSFRFSHSRRDDFYDSRTRRTFMGYHLAFRLLFASRICGICPSCSVENDIGADGYGNSIWWLHFLASVFSSYGCTTGYQEHASLDRETSVRGHSTGTKFCFLRWSKMLHFFFLDWALIRQWAPSQNWSVGR